MENNGWLEYTLDTTVNTFGYDVTQIDVFHGWQDDGRDRSNFSVSVSTVSLPDTFTTIYSGATYDPPSNYGRTSIVSVTATCVKKVRINFGAQENDWTGQSEIDVIGAAASSPAVPNAPSNLTATPISDTQINLAWTDNSDNEDGFQIERKTGVSGTWGQIDTVDADVTTYNDTGLSASTIYYYRVRAYIAAGGWAYSNEAGATTAEAGAKIVPQLPYNIAYNLSPIQITMLTTTGPYQIYDVYKTLVDSGTTTSNPQTITFTPPEYGWYMVAFGGDAKFIGVTPEFTNMNTLDGGEMSRGWNNEPLQAFSGLMLDRINTDAGFTTVHAVLDAANLYGVTLLVQFESAEDASSENVTAWVNEFKEQVHYWEVVNEPNFTMSVPDYVTLLQTVYPIIKGIDPTATVMGPDVCGLDLGWIGAFLAAGGGDYIDALSVHDYEGDGDIDPFHWQWKMDQIQALMNTYGIGSKPIWQTELAIGAIGANPGVNGVFMGPTQAIRLTLQRDLMELYGVTNNHNNHYFVDVTGFNLATFVYSDSGPHPAALACRTRCAMTQALNRTFVSKLDFGAPGNKMFLGLLYTGTGGSTLTLRNLGTNDLPVDLDISSGSSVDVMDSFGNVQNVSIVSGKATITTTQLPVYVQLASDQQVTASTIDLGTNIASQATFTYSGGSESDPALLTDGIMQIWHHGNPWGSPWSGPYTGMYFNETPETFDITFSSARQITGLLVYGAHASNPYSAILDYDVQYWNGSWVPLEEVRAACPASDVLDSYLCMVHTWLLDNNFYLHQFAEPVTTDKLRLVIRRISIGFIADKVATDAIGWDPSGHILQLREIEVYEGLAAPNAPSDLTATAVSDSQINLDWTDNSDNETGFAIERKTGVAGEWGQIDTVGEGVTTYNDTDLDPETEYYYRVRAYNGVGDSDYSNEANATTYPVGGGGGLKGEYYDNMDFTNLMVTRVDPTVDFDWGNGSPDPSIGVDTFSVRWTGQVEPLYSETYTFYTTTDDGVRLWVDNTLIVDKWIDQAPTEWSGTISLTAGIKYDIKIEYYENGGGAAAQLRWSSASQAKEIIPESQLYPTAEEVPNAPSNLTATAVSSSQIDLAWTDNSDNEDGFKIERKTGVAGEWAQIDLVGADVTTYNDTDLDPETEYYYRVLAYNTIGDSDYSNEANATTEAEGGGEHIYNFVGIEASDPDYNAYACDVDVFTFAGSSNNRNSQLEATDQQYVNISADNTAQWETLDPGRNDEVFLWVEMKITEAVGDITQIDLTFNGNTDGDAATTHKIYVLKAGADWTEDDSWVQVGTSLDIEPDVDTEMTRSITTSISDYIDGSGNITWGVYETRSSENLRINYLEMKVTSAP